MRKQKIALVNVFFPPQTIGGATRVLSDNFDILVEKYGDKFEFVVFTSDTSEQYKPHILNSYLYKGIRVYRSSVIFRENMDWQVKDSMMAKLFGKFLDFEMPDKVHFHCVQRLSASIVEMTLKKEIPYFITLHDAWWISDFQFLVDLEGKVYPNGHIDPYEKISLPNNISKHESIERKVYLFKLLYGAKKLFSVSESFQELYHKNGIGNIEVTKNGISKNIQWEKKKTEYSNRVVCGHIGGMSKHKGYDILKQSVVNSMVENLEFLIVDHSKAENYIFKEFWGKTPVTFIGHIKQEEIVALYQKIDVLFAPSIWPESFGLVTREAAACGCWVVASNLGGIGEDVLEETTGHIIEPTIEGLSNILMKIDKNFQKYKNVVIKNKVYYVEEQVKELVEFYND